MSNPRQISEVDVSPISDEFSCSNCSEHGTIKCSGCRAVMYCGRDCQQSQWSEHKQFCEDIQWYRQKTEEAAARLRKYKKWDEKTTNLFKAAVGHFWGLGDPRPYCRLRYSWAVTLQKYGEKNKSKMALEMSVEHLLDLVWLCRGDNMGVRFILPNSLLSLERLQESYDFIKWWQVCDPDGRYDWGDMSLPYLDIRNEDMFEDLDALKLETYTSVRWLSALFLLKFKLKIKTHGESMKEEEEDAAWKPLESQKEELFKMMDKANKFFIPALINPEPLLSQPAPGSSSHGSLEEAHVTLSDVLYVWQQNSDAIKDLAKRYRVMYGSSAAVDRIQRYNSNQF